MSEYITQLSEEDRSLVLQADRAAAQAVAVRNKLLENFAGKTFPPAESPESSSDSVAIFDISIEPDGNLRLCPR